MDLTFRPQVVVRNHTGASQALEAPRLAYPPRTEALTPLAITLGLLMWAGIATIVWALIKH